MLKDCDRSLKEIEDQKARIQSVVDDETKDDHDERKQKEVLEEYFAGQEDEKERLKQFYDKLCEVMDTAKEEDTIKEVEVTEEWTAAQKARDTAAAKLDALGVPLD